MANFYRETRNLLMIGFLLMGIKSYSQPNYFFTHIDSRNGLSENSIKSITQDHWGFIWLGTKNGLNRFDGNNIKKYDVDDLVKGRGNHNISALCEDDQHQLWVGTDKGVFIYNPYTELFSFFDKKTSRGESIQNWIAQIKEDTRGNIWIISPEEGAFRYDTKTRRLYVYRPSREKSSEKNPSCVLERKNGELWLGTNGAGLYRYVYSTDQLEHHLEDADGNSLKGFDIYTLCDYEDWIVVAEHLDKLLKYNPTTNTLREFNAPEVNYKVLRALCYDGHDLIVGTQDGLYFINEAKNQVKCVKENDILPNGLSDNMIYSLYLDRDNGIWVGTKQSGVNYLSRKGIIFYCYVPLGTQNSLSDKRIREMVKVPNGDIWIATDEGYINIFHPKAQTFERLNTPLYKRGATRLAMMVNGNEVWSGLFKNGLDIIDISTHGVTHYTPEQLGLQKEGSVFALFKDRTGEIWLGSGSGLYRKKQGMHFEKDTSFSTAFCQDIAQDRNGNIWIATIGFGVYCYQPATGKVTKYSHYKGDPGSLSSNDVSSITIDSKGLIWFSTDRGGLCVFNPKSKKFTTYSKSSGLPDDVVYKVLEDHNHYYWFGTNQGIVRLLPAKKGKANIIIYHNTTGLQGNQYNYKSGVETSNGVFLFGGSCGLVAFNPDLAISSNQSKFVYITNIRVNNQEIKAGNHDILDRNITHAKEIKLPYDFSTVSFDISSLNYSGTEGVGYEYMLEGVNNNWIYSKNGKDINYSRLQPGTYTLKIRNTILPDKITELKIIVRHPWWSSLLAKFFYTLLLIVAVILFFKYMQRRQQRQLLLSQKQLREEQDKELMRSKINFFTDITHEIRTPLTLINGSVEGLETADISDPTIKKALNAVQKNCKRLLNLINQLLDFRKMDTNSMSMNFIKTDICKLIQEIIDRFEPSITNINKAISLDCVEDAIVIPVDREALTKIISNLLNNARKYSETFVQVVISKHEDTVEIDVQNDGARIPNDKVDEIFQPFTRLDNDNTVNATGSGIGLPLARSLAELHKGKLELNKASEYNSFVLTLPMHQDHVIEINENESAVLNTTLEDVAIEDYDTSHIDNRYTVLLVEDNPEVLDMLVTYMKERYNLLTALNGHQGLDIAKSKHLDIIVSDIMMPVMDGLEMTRLIKEDVEINHIPIILLTARQTLTNRLEGLRAGADAYIEKPFSFAHLMTQLESLLDNRRRERESYLHKPYLSVQNTNINKVDEEFLNKISNIIIANIKDPNFNVEKLSEEMFMSRSSLHRKIKEVTDMTPIDFIRLIKLKKAAELIREQGYRSTEVCEMIGLNSSSYFIKLFQKQFGMTPKEFASGKDITS